MILNELVTAYNDHSSIHVKFNANLSPDEYLRFLQALRLVPAELNEHPSTKSDKEKSE